MRLNSLSGLCVRPNEKEKTLDECFHGGQLFCSVGQDFSRLRNRDLSYAADVLDAWYPPAPAVIETLKSHLPWTCRTSPPPSNLNIISLISSEYQLGAEQIVLGHGSSDLIYRVLPSLIDERGALIIKPAYGEYEHVIQNLLDIKVVSYSTADNNFELDVDDIIRHANNDKVSAVILINPCNPTGQVFSRKQLLKLHEGVSKNTNLIIDETYSEYCNREYSLANIVGDVSNLAIFKSLSKTYALSGMRAGFCILNKELARYHQQRTPPYTIPMPTQVALFETFKNKSYYQEQIERTHLSRDHFCSLLNSDAPQLKTLPSSINSVLIDLEKSAGDAEDLRKYLAKKSIYIRNIDSQGISRHGRYVRVSILSKTDMSVIADAISEWHQELQK
ncbi:MAG: histidinol-phosphate/aromatic aminotransferase/cobyric acid decarboxylase-like protein [Candidatus Krumholzibacteriia bacterium]|jgi:histidinol-phosphate/aromatic aminotransferase/cobyric acid decarboxylase-like protein